MTQKKKRLSLIRSLFLPRGLQSRNMILFLFPVTDILLSQGQSNTLDLLFRFQSLPHQSPIVAPKVFSILRGSVCARLLPVKRALCYLFARGHTFLDWSRKTPTLAQGKQLLQWGQMGWHGEGLALHQSLRGFSLLLCTSLLRNTTMDTWKPASFPLGVGKGSCMVGGPGAAVTQIPWCQHLVQKTAKLKGSTRNKIRNFPVSEIRRLLLPW